MLHECCISPREDGVCQLQSLRDDRDVACCVLLTLMASIFADIDTTIDAAIAAAIVAAFAVAMLPSY